MAHNLCLLDKNLTKVDACGYSLKQIVEIYLANYSDITKVDRADDGYTVTAATPANVKWYKIEPAKDSSSYNDDLAVGGNGSKYRIHTMTFSFNSAYDVNVAEVLDHLSLGKFVAILKTSDEKYLMLGAKTGLEASAASSLSEAAADGQNGITVTLECNTTETALVVDMTPTAVKDGEGDTAVVTHYTFA